MAGVFVSYRSQDIELAERLAAALQASGHQVWLDVWNIALGDSIIEQIGEGMAKSAYVVVCYSSAGVTSPWMSREWMSALARRLEGHDVKLLPVRLSGGEPPVIIADVKYADLVRDWEQGLAELLRAID